MAGLRACIVSLVLLLALVVTGPARAHASLVASDPADGIVLEKAPAAAVLTFDEPAELTALRLIAPDGSRKDAPATAERRVSHRLPLPQGQAQGTYVLTWRAVSQDGHPVGGAVVFSVGQVSAAPDGEIGTPSASARMLWLARLLMAAGTAFGIGGVAFLLLLAPGAAWPGRLRPVLAGALAAGGLGAVASIGLQGLDLAGAGLDRLTDPAIWSAGLMRTPQGLTAILATAAFAAAGLGARWRARTPALVALALSGAAFAASGHAALASPRWLMQPAVFLHATAMTLWLGALLPLAALAHTGAAALDGALRRFGEAIPYGLVLLFGSGLALAFVQLGALPALWRTAYGQVFLIKLGLLAFVLALALRNRFLTPRVLAGDAAGRRRLIASITAETLLTFGVLGAAGLWRFTVPPRTLPAAIPDAILSLSGEGLAVRIRVRPPRMGKVRLLVEDIRLDPAGTLPRELTLTLEKPSFGLGPFRKTIAPGPSGAFPAVDMFLPMDGIWVLGLDVLVDDYRQVSLRDVLTLAAG